MVTCFDSCATYRADTSIAISTFARRLNPLPSSQTLRVACLLLIPNKHKNICRKAGVECTKEYLEGSEGKEEVVGEYEKGVRAHGITGVPYFIISREGSSATVPLSGGQPPAAFIEAFEALS